MLASVGGSAAQLPQPDTPSPNPRPIQAVRVYYADRATLDVLVSEFDVWEVHPDYVVAGVDERALAALRAIGLRVEVDPVLTATLGPVPDPFYNGYKTVEEIEAFLGQQALTYPNLAQLVDYGDSWCKLHPPCNYLSYPAWNGFDLWALRITNIATPGPKPVFFLIANVHAREIATPEVAMRFISWLLDGYGVNPDATWMVDRLTIYVIAEANPDGHHIVETGNMNPVSWRKNADDDDGCSTSFGTDLNRNHNFQWGTFGSSTNPCSETYRGPSAGSEPETAALQNYMASIFPDQRPDDLTTPAPITSTGIMLSLHSYANELDPPWSWNWSPSPNHAQIMTLERKLASTSGGVYVACEPGLGGCATAYVASGVTEDWTYGRLGVMGFTVEVGNTGFFPSYASLDSTLWPTTRPMLIYAARTAQRPYQWAYGPDALNLATTPASVAPGQPVTLTATINDTQNGNQPIAAAEYLLSKVGDPTVTIGLPGSGAPMQPADGSFNSPTEGAIAVVNTTSLTQGRYYLLVRGRDSGDNWGPLFGVFFDVAPNSINFTLAPTGLSDIAIALDVSGAGITNAESLADYVELQGGTGFGSVQQVLKWSAPTQSFLAWSHEFQFGDNFTLALGDYVFLVTNGGPSSVTFTGRRPNSGEVRFNLTAGQPAPDCALNFLSLPYDRAQLDTADELSDDVGGVVQALDWHTPVQNFLAWSNQFGFGDNFTTTVGYPYAVCLDNTAPAMWP
jgi:hypothetical protein